MSEPGASTSALTPVGVVALAVRGAVMVRILIMEYGSTPYVGMAPKKMAYISLPRTVSVNALRCDL